MKEPISTIEASLNNTPAPTIDNGEERLNAIADALGKMIANNTLPEGFDLEKACTDAGFIKLTREMPMEAAVRVYAAEQRAMKAEENARAELAAKMQNRTALPQSARPMGGANVTRDYKNMSSEEFAALEQQFRRAAQQGIRVRL